MRRLLLPVTVLLISFGALQVAAAPPALAHPLGNFTVNRYSGIELSGGTVAIRYVLDMAEIPAFQERSAIDVNGDETLSVAEREAWAGREARVVLSGLHLSVDDRLVNLSLACGDMRLRPGQGGLSTLRMEAVYTGRLPEAGRARYVDANEPDRLGWREVTLRAFENASVSSSSVPSSSPSRELLRYPADLLQSPLDVREATFSFANGRTSGDQAPEPCGGGAALAEAPAAGGFAALVTWKLTPAVLLFSLLVAFLFGALHALGPGHGKTIMAAYLVGAGARLRHAVSVGIAVSLMHTASVLGLGLIALFASRLFPAEAVYPWLGLLTGAVVLGLGSFLLAGRLRARRAEGGARSDGPQSHPHPHPHPQPSDGAVETGDAAGGPISRRGLTALAVSGGLLPSPTALVVLLGAVALHRVAYGISLVLAFSGGLAVALIIVGTVAVRARSFLSRRARSGLAPWLPVASAGVIVVAGTFLVIRATLQLG